MAKQNILIVDADPESIKVLEVSLKKVGYSVTRAESGTDALELIGFSAPDLIISETKLPRMDGFEFCTKLKENEEWADIPFIFLTSERSIEDKIRGLELGVDDYLTKPIFIREILVRVNLGLQRREKERLEHRGSKSKFSGNLQDMGVVDLIQTIDLGHKSGVIHIERPDDAGDIFFSEGRMIDARTLSRTGPDAIYRMLVWSEGTFEIEFKSIERKQTISLSTQGILMEGMRRLDEWGRLQEQLPTLSSVFDIDAEILAERLGEIPDEVNSILRNFDGRSSLLEVVDKGELGDLEALTVITKLYFEGLISEVSTLPPEPAAPSMPPEPTTPDLPLTDRDSSPRGTASAPEKVVTDNIGPRMSIAAQGEGFVAALTAFQPMSPLKKMAEPVKVKDVVTTTPIVEPTAKREVPTVPAKEKVVTPGPPPRQVPNESKTMMGIRVAAPKSEEAPESSPTSPGPPLAMKDDESPPVPVVADQGALSGGGPMSQVVDTGASSKKVEPSLHDTSKYGDRSSKAREAEISEAMRIAAAIDQEVPPAKEKLPVKGDGGEDDSEYFPATSYKAAMDWRSEATSEPPAAYDVSDGDGAEADEFDDYWEESEPSKRGKRVVMVIGVVLVLALGGIGFWIWQQDRAEAYFDNAPIVNTPDNHYQSALKVTTVEMPTRKRPASSQDDSKVGLGEDSVQKGGAAQEKSSNGAAETPEAAVPDESPTVGAEPSSEANVEPGVAPSAPTPAVSSDAQARYDEIMKKVGKSGRKKQTELLREAIAVNPSGDRAMALLAINLMERKQSRPEALDLAEQAARINPDNGAAWMAVAYIHQLNGDLPAAKEAYRKCAACSGPKQYVSECRLLAR